MLWSDHEGQFNSLNRQVNYRLFDLLVIIWCHKADIFPRTFFPNFIYRMVILQLHIGLYYYCMVIFYGRLKFMWQTRAIFLDPLLDFTEWYDIDMDIGYILSLRLINNKKMIRTFVNLSDFSWNIILILQGVATLSSIW